jgi:hypothetical protein
MSEKKLHLLAARSLFCLPVDADPEECSVYRIVDDTLLSAGLKPGMFAVTTRLSKGDRYRNGDLAVITIRGLYVVKRIYSYHPGVLHLRDDLGEYGPYPLGLAQLLSRVIHACTGDPRACRGWMLDCIREGTLPRRAGAGRLAS